MILRLLGLAFVAASMAGCIGTVGSNHLELMKQHNARGCVYIRGSGKPYADASLMVIGTWGTDPPPYAECWKGLPVSVP